MEIFKELNRLLISLGVWRANSSARGRNVCIIKNCLVLSTLLTYFVTSAWFRIFSAQTIHETTVSSNVALNALLCIVWYSALTLQRENYAAIFNELNTIIEQRKYDLGLKYKLNQSRNRSEMLCYSDNNSFTNQNATKDIYSLLGTSDHSAKIFYQCTNQKIDFITKNLHLAFHIVACLYSLFPITSSIFKYIASGYSNEFFELIYPAT